MALRNIREKGDNILGKVCKEVKELDERTLDLIEDMYETMYDANGVGLAAPQVGILKRICVIDVSPEGNEPMCLINPVVTWTSEEVQTGFEGCLSVPGKSGVVTRPMEAKVSCLNEKFEPVEISGAGLLARALLHEIDHLDGHLYVEKVEGKLYDNSELEEAMEEEQ